MVEENPIVEVVYGVEELMEDRELVKKAARLLKSAPDEVKEGWLEGFIEVFVDDGEEVPPLNELVDAWEENQRDSLGYEDATQEIRDIIGHIKEDIWKYNVTKEELFAEIAQGNIEQSIKNRTIDILKRELRELNEIAAKLIKNKK